MTDLVPLAPAEVAVPVQSAEDAGTPCPEGCGGLTEDPYGGPCQRCEDSWSVVTASASDD